jgi:hypothetical protein
VATGERRVIPLDEVRADGWFEGLAAGAPGFAQLCEIVGERFVAFSAIADVRITALTVDPRQPGASQVDFHIGDSDRQHRLPLAEFQRRVAAALLAEEPPLVGAEPPPDPEGLRSFIGAVPILLAPIFGLRLLTLHGGGGEPPTVVLQEGDFEDELSLEAFRERIRGLVRREVERQQPAEGRVSFDLALVAQAEDANRVGDWARTIELLGAWPGPLSMFLRTPEAQRLTAADRATLARGLGLLGTAYAEEGRPDWAEEILRLAIQCRQDGAVGGDLFCRLGMTYVTQDRPGEAIGLLRRALALGVHPSRALPALARCYVARGRYVAAAACLDEALAAGLDVQAMASVRADVEARIGPAWSQFRALAPLGSGTRSTRPPPGDS